MHHEIKAALKSLPWYIVFSFVLFPLIAAPFSAGWSLALYIGYLLGKWQAFVMSGAVGVFIWVIRQTFRAAFFQWKQRHRVSIY